MSAWTGRARRRKRLRDVSHTFRHTLNKAPTGGRAENRGDQAIRRLTPIQVGSILRGGWPNTSDRQEHRRSCLGFRSEETCHSDLEAARWPKGVGCRPFLAAAPAPKLRRASNANGPGPTVDGGISNERREEAERLESKGHGYGRQHRGCCRRDQYLHY
jgi:hypothetical protein